MSIRSRSSLGWRIAATAWWMTLALTVLAFPVTAGAQDNDDTGKGGDEVGEREVFESEIVVTARKREESPQDVPIAITAYSDAALEARSMRDLTNVADFTPNVDFSVSGGAGGSPSEATVYIRGVGQIETGIMADPGVGIYVDGVYIARSQGAVFDLLDLERVEVLRGPQGTLFGKNTTGGAIHLITRKPSADFGGSLTATAGDLDRRDVSFRIGGALGERLFGSLAALSTRRDGWTTSVENGRVFADDNRDSARGALRWLASDRINVDFTVDWMQERESALDQNLIAVYPGPFTQFYNQVLADNGLPTVTDEFITGDLYRSHSDGPSRNDGDVGFASLRFTATGRNVELLSITAYRDVEFFGASDFDGTPIRYFERRYRQTQDQLSQELQLSGRALGDRLSWVAGALYFEENPIDASVTHSLENLYDLLETTPGPIYSPPGAPAFLCNPGPPPPGVPCFGGAGNPANLFFYFGDGAIDRLELDTVSYAVFGEGTLALSDDLSLTAGLRYTYDEKDVTFVGFAEPEILPRRNLADKRDWDAVSPRLSLSWNAREDLLLYLSASQGFKSGGFNAARAIDQNDLFPYEPETLWAYEAGLKSDFSNNLRLNASVFYYDYTDVQFASFLFVGNQQFLVIQNAADATIQGLELEIEAHPMPGLQLSLGVGAVDSEFTELRNEGGAPLDGVFPKTPDWKVIASAQYAFDAGDAGSFILRGDYSWRDDFYHDVANSEFIAQEAYGLFNARLVWAPNNAWEVALFGTNLGDEEYTEHGFDSVVTGTATVIAGRPREWGLSAQFRF